MSVWERAEGMSRYRQVRLTFTEERGGRLTYSIYGKGLNDEWNEHQVLERSHVHWMSGLNSLDEVKIALINILEESLGEATG